MKSKQLSRNLYIVVTTLIVFAVGYYLYIEVYSRNKEDHIIATKSRILEQMSQNFRDKVNSLGTNSKEYVSYLLQTSGKGDSINIKFESALINRKDIQYYNSNLEYVNCVINENADELPDELFLKIIPVPKPDFMSFRLLLGKKYSKIKKKEIQFRTKYDLLISDYIQRNIFSNYILIVDDEVVYSTLPNKPNLAVIGSKNVTKPSDEGNGATEKKQGEIELSSNSSNIPAVIQGVTNYDISISNNQYKMFMCQTQIDNKKLYICGLVDGDQFNQAKKGIAPRVFIFVFMILSLIILGLPFIKLKVMSQTEQLTSGTLLNSAISLFFGTSFIILFIFFVTNAYWFNNQQNHKLNQFARELNDTLNLEINNAWQQLEVYDSISRSNPDFGGKMPENANILASFSKLKPEIYPYFDFAFWLGPDGLQQGLTTPFLKADKPSNLSGRDYFNRPDEWILPGKGNESKRFKMESIVSVTSGAVKVALSRKSNRSDTIIALTGRFYSIIDPIIPGAYEFCIIDQKGKVLFHSEKLKNLNENFITECGDDKNLIAAIYANSTKNLVVDYYDEPFRINVRPLAPIPLYLVTMIDKQSEYAFQVQSLMLTLLLFSALVFFIILESLSFYILKSFGKKAGWKNLIVDFFCAKENKNKIYIVMSILFLLVTFFFFILSKPINILNPLFFAIVMISLLLPYLNYAINDFSMKLDGRNLFTVLNIFILIATNIAAKQLFINDELVRIYAFQGIILLLFILGFFALKRKYKIKSRNCNVTFYVFFLMALLLTFSVAPSIKFFEASVNHEIIRSVKHDQLQLAMQREFRNKQLRSYYKLLEDGQELNPKIENVFVKRMEQGVYLNFLGTSFHIPYPKPPLDTCKNIRVERSEDLINFFRPVYDRVSIETKYLENNKLKNGHQNWVTRNDTIFFNYLTINEKYANQKPVSGIIVTKFKLPSIFNPLLEVGSTKNISIFQKYNLFFLLLLLIIYLTIYFLILFGTRKLLGVSILEMHTPYNFGDFLCDRIESGHSVLAVGSPFIDLHEFIDEKLKADNFVTSWMDLSAIESIPSINSDRKENEVQIIENFAFDYYTQPTLDLHLKIINEKIRTKEKIVIISLHSPYVIQDYLEEKAKSNEDSKIRDKSDTDLDSWEKLLMSFNNILSNTNILFASERYDENLHKHDCFSKSECKRILEDYTGEYGENIRCLICKELAASTYMQRYSVEMMKFYNMLVKSEVPAEIMKNRIISRIMDLGRLYYDNILSTCTPLERFVLSDMAQDMIVNSKNRKVVVLLIHRGLFVIKGCTITFMNESFRRHLLMRYNAEERALLIAKLGDNGTSWQGYKLFLVLIMVGLFSFLFIANRSILDNLNKLFIVIGGGTVLITNLTGFLTRKENGNSK